ncbi:hypothetical protein ACE6H2_026854 [Prunus campanulata]
MGFRLPGIVNSKKGLKKAATSKTLDIPKGYFAVYVGESKKRQKDASECKPSPLPPNHLTRNDASIPTKPLNFFDTWHCVVTTHLPFSTLHAEHARDPSDKRSDVNPSVWHLSCQMRKGTHATRVVASHLPFRTLCAKLARDPRDERDDVNPSVLHPSCRTRKGTDTTQVVASHLSFGTLRAERARGLMRHV